MAERLRVIRRTAGGFRPVHLQIYGKSMEYPPKFGRNANLKLGIKQLGEKRGSWAEG
jgi:hypothetical protein